MKPNFALNLSHDGIELYHRRPTGWSTVGRVALDDPDLGPTLDIMRRNASDLESRGLTTKVIIPESQILYTELEVPGDGPDRPAAIRRALEGRTPYPVADLVFDWRPLAGNSVQLAVVARETLSEAEAFAQEHRFNPVSFAAMPEDGHFAGEPYFGPAPSAAALLAEAGPVEPDEAPVTAKTMPLPAREPEDAASEETEPEDAASDAQSDVPLPEESLPADTSAVDVDVAETDTQADARPDMDERVETPVEPPKSHPDAAPDSLPADPEPTDDEAPMAADVEPEDDPDTLSGPDGPSPGGPRGPGGPGANVYSLRPEAGDPAAEEPRAEEVDAIAAASAEDAMPAFASRRRVGEREDLPPAPERRMTVRPPEAEATPPREGADSAEDSPLARPMPDDRPHRAPEALLRDPGAGAADAPATGEGQRAPDGAGPAAPPVLRRLPAAPARKGTPGPGKRAPVIDFKPGKRAAAAAASSMPSGAEADPVPDMPAPARGTGPAGPADLGVFGKADPTPRRSPAVMIVLTVVLLIGLAALALWSTFWSDPTTPEQTAQAGQSEGGAITPQPNLPTPPADAGTVNPSMADEAAADGVPLDPTADSVASAEAEDVPAAPEAPALPGEPGGATDLAALPDAATPPADAPAGAAPQDEQAAPTAQASPDTPEGSDTPAPVEDELAATGPATPALPQDPMTELVGTDEGAAERVAAQLREELTPEVAERRYASTGVWVLPPDPPADPNYDSVDNLYVASIDEVVPAEDAVALPGASEDKAMLSPLPPAPAGTKFNLDDRGMVIPTPEGVLNPDGLMVTLGTPPVTPPPRPGSVAAEAADAEAAAAAQDNTAAPTDPADPNAGLPRAPGVPKVRPKWRPDDLTQLNERFNLGGRTRTELAQIKPRPRPGVVQALYEAQQDPATPEETFAELAPATDQAVATSLTPQDRPGNIARIAAEARDRQAEQVAAAAAAAAAASSRPAASSAEADNEPEALASAPAVMPKGPAGSTVARSATVANAINLRQVNLIGVYGSPKQRRALVRMGNGKYVKVQVGDRLDGGRVAAIGDSELIYVKGGRQVRLQMPSKT